MKLAVKELARCEGVIERGLATFFEVGAALKEIRDRRLYKADFKTFEAYCTGRWGWGRNYTNKTIAAADTASLLGTTSTQKPTHETQVRPLVGLPPKKQSEAWTAATKDHDNPTESQVRRAVAQVVGPKKESSETRPRGSFQHGSLVVEILRQTTSDLGGVLELKRPDLATQSMVGDELMRLRKMVKRVSKHLGMEGI